MTLDQITDEINRALTTRLDYLISDQLGPLTDAMRWSVLGGGKRLRGSLVCTSALAWGAKDLRSAMDLAMAVEFMHAYSLVHDDLPAMDDAATRRGKPSTHKQFSEAMAVLAGDALQTLAFDVIADSDELSDSQKVRATQTLSDAAGWNGMVGGQAWDIDQSRLPSDEEELASMHRGKTGALFKASLLMGMIVSDQDIDHEQRNWATHVGIKLGSVFQMVDDVIDVTQSEQTTGKPVQQDGLAGKVTYPSLIGLVETKKRMEETRNDLLKHFSKYGLENSLLVRVAVRCIERVS